ncbi:MAG TPA: hypothetical protein VJM48_13500, partial [Methylibium sp.]|nr:hypothetical protein [Methylibium sp.]
MLLLVDGKRSRDEVLGLAQQVGVGATHFDELIEWGMVAGEPVALPVTEPVAEPVAEAAAADVAPVAEPGASVADEPEVAVAPEPEAAVTPALEAVQAPAAAVPVEAGPGDE